MVSRADEYEYRDSGIEWLGEVPEHWTVGNLGHALNAVGDVDHHMPPSVEKGVPYVMTGDLEELVSQIDFAKCKQVAHHDYQRLCEKIKTTKGDLIMAKYATVGSVSYVDVDSEFLVSYSCATLKPNTEKTLGSYLFFCLKSDSFAHGIRQKINTNTQENVGNATLKKVKVALPPKDEQRQIALFLDYETSKIDALISKQQQLIALLGEKRQAVISHAVTKGLNPDAPMRDSGIQWLGDVPEHWTVGELKRFATVNTGVAKGKNLAGQKTVTVPYLRVANVQDGYLELDDVTTIDILEHELERYRLLPGDVLMNEGGDFDKLGRGDVWQGQLDPCITQNHVFAVRPTRMQSRWLNRVSSSHYGQFYFKTRSKQSTNLASISSTNLMQLPIAVPPDEEQTEILTFIEQAIEKFNQLLAFAGDQVELLQERRTALISAAVTGKIDVRGWKPPSSPAKQETEMEVA